MGEPNFPPPIEVFSDDQLRQSSNSDMVNMSGDLMEKQHSDDLES